MNFCLIQSQVLRGVDLDRSQVTQSAARKLKKLKQPNLYGVMIRGNVNYFEFVGFTGAIIM
jgi:hypothetical protein